MLEVFYSLRSILYIATAYIFFVLAQFYNKANIFRKKRSLIIDRMVSFYISMGLFFIYLAVVPIIRLFNQELYLRLTNYLCVVILPSIVFGWLFWQSIFEDDDGNPLKVK
ncbi:MAG: hypothetical protein QXY47_05280 [Thermoplasmata archaeon]